VKLLGCYEEVSVFAGAATVLGLLRPVFFVRGLRTGFPPRLPAVASSGGTAAESCGEGGGGGAGGGGDRLILAVAAAAYGFSRRLPLPLAAFPVATLAAFPAPLPPAPTP